MNNRRKLGRQESTDSASPLLADVLNKHTSKPFSTDDETYVEAKSSVGSSTSARPLTMPTPSSSSINNDSVNSTPKHIHTNDAVESNRNKRNRRSEESKRSRESFSRSRLVHRSTDDELSRKSSALNRVFPQKFDFNFLAEATGLSQKRHSSDEESSLSDRELFEYLYRKVRKNRRKRSETTETDSTEMSDSSTDEAKKPNWKQKMFGKQFRKRAFWIIVTILAALTIKDVFELVTEYSTDPKQSDINVVFNESMVMPNITFCMMKNQAYSHFNITFDDEWDKIVDKKLGGLKDREKFLTEKWDYRMAVEGYEVISALGSMERETSSIHGTVHSITKFRTMPRLEAKRKMIQKWIDHLQERNVTFEEFTQKVGVEIIRPSMQRFQRFTYNEDITIPTKFRTSWISEKQFCFQPWSYDPNYMTVEDQGRFFTMSLSHNGENLDNKSVGCMSVDFHGRPSSLNRFMEGKGRARDGFDDELCMGQYHEVVVEVRALYEMLENEENGTICKEQKDGEDNEFDCRSRCRMEMIRNLCHCTPLTLSYLEKDNEAFKKYPLCDYTKCVLDVQNQKYTDSDCQKKCRRDCTQIRFNVNHKTQGRLLRPDMTVLELHWGSFEYLSMKQDWVWSVATFIAALGGSIGMWLGLSILSLIQGGTYIYSYLSDTVIKKKIKKRRVSSSASIIKKEHEDVKKVDAFKANPLKSPFKPKQKYDPNEAPPEYNNNIPAQQQSTNIQID